MPRNSPVAGELITDANLAGFDSSPRRGALHRRRPDRLRSSTASQRFQRLDAVVQFAWVGALKQIRLPGTITFVPYLDASHDSGRNHPTGEKPDRDWDPLREALGQTGRIAQRMDLRAARPHEELASSSFCLASLGQQYLVYLPQGGEVSVDLTAASGTLNMEWMRPDEGTELPIEHCAGGGRAKLKAPFAGDAVLYVWR